jgi:hypothetical protein
MTLAADYRAGWRFGRALGLPSLKHADLPLGCWRCDAFWRGIYDANHAPLDQACDPWAAGFDDPVATARDQGALAVACLSAERPDPEAARALFVDALDWLDNTEGG